jgi:hypothetical protein
MRYLDIKNMQVLQDYAHKRYFVQLKPGDSYADLFIPTFWAYHRGRLDSNDLIRVRAHDGSFDVSLTVAEVKTDGVVMQRWPIEPQASVIQSAAEIGSVERVVPFGPDGDPVVRVEFLPATKWRVLGLKGEVSSGHKDEATAIKARDDYLNGIRYVLPDTAAVATEKERLAVRAAEAAETAATKKRAKV